MAKASKKSSPSKRDVSEEVTALKDEGKEAFGKREYVKALEAYDKALRALPEGNSDVPLMHSNKAACNMMLKRYKEAINECSAALELNPSYSRALVRRAKAYEQMQHYKQALSDLQKINRGDDATADTRESERRLRDLLAGKKPQGGGGGGGGDAAAVAPSVGSNKKSVAARGSQLQLFQAKCTLGSETKLVQLSGISTYAELMHSVRAKFPNAGPFQLKFLDREGDLVTITSRQDLIRALNEAVLAGESMGAGHGPRLGQQMLPALRISVVEVPEGDVPPVPVSEEDEFLSMLKQQANILHQLQQQRGLAPAPLPAESAQESQTVELDQWLIEFANLFREHTGLDPERHLDLNAVGWDRIQDALEAVVDDDRSLPLFEEAEKKFQETAAHGLLQWGHVSMLRARKFLDAAVLGGNSIDSVLEQVEGELAKAEAKFRESLGVKPDYVDAFQMLADLSMQRAKLAARFHAPLPRGPTRAEAEAVKAAGDKRSDQEIAAEQNKAASAAAHAALDALAPEDAGKGSELFQKAYDLIRQGIDTIPEADRTVKKMPEPPKEGETATPEEPISMYQQALLSWGNLQYEESQMVAVAGGDWRAVLDEATAHFREAGCNETDIRGALKSHYKGGELDLGPDPKPADTVAPPTPAAAEAPKTNGSATQAEKDVLGLPSLGPAPKKKPAAKEAAATQ